MIELPADEFARLCFLVLMQSGEGILDKHPSYIREKERMLDAGYEAFFELDIHNMRKVRQYCEHWGILLPREQVRALRNEGIAQDFV